MACFWRLLCLYLSDAVNIRAKKVKLVGPGGLEPPTSAV